MKPALEPTVVSFVPVLGLVLGTALVVIGALTPGLRRQRPELVRELWLRLGSWIAIAVAVLGALVLARGAWIALVTLLSLVAVREYSRAVGLWQDRGVQAVIDASIVLIGVAAWWPAPEGETPGWWGLFVAAPVLGTLALFAVPIIGDRFRGMLQQACLALLGLVWFAWMLGHLSYLVNLRGGAGLVLLSAFLVGLHDVGAFVTGKLAGRVPLRPALSPRKTWEGTAGALVVVVAAAQGLGWLAPDLSRLHLVGLGLLVSVGATVGDLALSMVKRDLGIKDWGAAVPGHGGVLDRLNSLVFTAPIVFHYLRSILGDAS